MQTSSQTDSQVELGGNNVCLFLSHWLKLGEKLSHTGGRGGGGTLLFYTKSCFYRPLRQYPGQEAGFRTGNLPNKADCRVGCPRI